MGEKLFWAYLLGGINDKIMLRAGEFHKYIF